MLDPDFEEMQEYVITEKGLEVVRVAEELFKEGCTVEEIALDLGLHEAQLRILIAMAGNVP